MLTNEPYCKVLPVVFTEMLLKKHFGFPKERISEHCFFHYKEPFVE